MITYDCHIAGSGGGTFLELRLETITGVQIHVLDNTDGNTIRARGSLFLAWTRAHSRHLFSLPSEFTFGREKVIVHEV